MLARVIGLFSGRGYNIESLTVAEVDKTRHLSRINIVTTGTEAVIEQIKSLLAKLVPVHKVQDLTIEGPHVERAAGEGDRRPGAADRGLRIADYMHARLVDSAPGSLVLEATGTSDELEPSSSWSSRSRSAGPAWSRSAAAASSWKQGPADRPPPSSARRRAASQQSGESTMRVYYDADADLNLIKGKKVAVIGYGSQELRPLQP